MWENYRILNVIILLHNQLANFVSNCEFIQFCSEQAKMVSVYDLYSWFPYTSEKECDQIDSATLIDRWLVYEDMVFKKTNNLFPNKVKNDLHGCSLKVSTVEANMGVFEIHNQADENKTTTYEFSGTEILFLVHIAEALNMTLFYNSPPPSTFTHSDKHTMTLIDVVNGAADVTLSSYPLHVLLHKMADPTFYYYFSYVKWFAPCPKPVPRSDKIISIFSISVWLSMSLVFVQISVVLWGMANNANTSLARESKIYNTISNCCYCAWAVTMGMSVPEMPRTTRLRIVFMIFVFYCFAISTIFQTFFTTYLVEPGIQKQIDSFQELLDSQYIYAAEYSWDFHINLSTYEYYKQITLRKFYCWESECLKFLLMEDDKVTITNTDHVQFFKSSFLSIPNNYNSICSILDPIYTHQIVMYMTKGSPLLNPVNKIIRSLVEAGFTQKFEWDIKSELRLRSSRLEYNISHEYNDESSDSMHFVISFSHLDVAYYLLLMGHCFSFIIFILENMYMKFIRLCFCQ
ncbi:hypothetical protein L9F63_015464 [Diploptera punctata]|uniref:Ionotropic glutamate receptor C-terminal domain-containing protein n=1 Tax=Diploptera punctata TaxID=6984 RepID=A0AAD8EJV6_DIPPU|nr:hypothetical protein L9F63_015464 [Diploptera punctata]